MLHYNKYYSFNRLKDLRQDNDLKQIDLAKKIGATQTSMSNWELGIKSVPVTALIELSLIYNVSVDYILGMDRIRSFQKSKTIKKEKTENISIIIHQNLTEQDENMLQKIADHIDKIRTEIKGCHK